MKVLRLHHGQVSTPKGCEDVAREFYCCFFRTYRDSQARLTSGVWWIWIQLGDTQVHFGAEDGVERKVTRAHLAYQISNLSEWKSRLTQRTIEILDGIPIPGYDRFEFRDPFGNRVEFLQSLNDKDGDA